MDGGGGESTAYSVANNGGGKRKIGDDVIELAKQKAQAIVARLSSDADAKRPRSDPSLSSPPSYAASQSSFPVSYAPQTNQYNGVPNSKKILIPSAKVGVIIGRGGDMIKNLQLQSGARIQITRDADADRTSLTRDVELMGSQAQINRAEELINEVIAETDAASSVSSGTRNVGPPQPGSEQFVMKVPNDKVALVIGKGGETIKNMQTRTGARIQVVPLHPPPGDTSTERNLYINGTTDQIEAAKELVNEVISGNRLKVLPSANTYTQSAYPQATGWPPQGQPAAQQPPAYGYTQAGSYPMQPPPYYGGYLPQPTGWEQQTTAPPAASSQQQNTGYNAYGQQVPPSSTPPSVNYNYSQIQPASSYNYNQGYPQQPAYGQDMSAQAQAQALTQAPSAAPVPDQAKAYSNPTYGPPATTSQPDGSAATAQTSQPGYGTPVSAGQPEGTTQTQAPSAYPTNYTQPAPAPTPTNGYGAYLSYSGAPSVQPTYAQAGYQQMGYGQQQQGQVANQASYAYYGQSGYPPSQAPVQTGYYQGSYPQVAPGQGLPQSGNGATQSINYGADGGEVAAGPVAPAPTSGTTEGSENPQS